MSRIRLSDSAFELVTMVTAARARTAPDYGLTHWKIERMVSPVVENMLAPASRGNVNIAVEAHSLER